MEHTLTGDSTGCDKIHMEFTPDDLKFCALVNLVT
jgi:hypothetical protein